MPTAQDVTDEGVMQFSIMHQAMNGLSDVFSDAHMSVFPSIANAQQHTYMQDMLAHIHEQLVTLHQHARWAAEQAGTYVPGTHAGAQRPTALAIPTTPYTR